MDVPAAHHHRIDYVELAVTDLAAAKAFYAAAFGWRFNDYGPAYSGFVASGDERESGGLNADPDLPAGGSPFVVLYSADLDASLAAVRAAGGDISVAPYAFPGGRRFHFTDPGGNTLGVWQQA